MWPACGLGPSPRELAVTIGRDSVDDLRRLARSGGTVINRTIAGSASMRWFAAFQPSGSVIQRVDGASGRFPRAYAAPADVIDCIFIQDWSV